MHHRAEPSGRRDDGADAARGRVARGRRDPGAARPGRRHAALTVLRGLCLAAALHAAAHPAAAQATPGNPTERLSSDWKRLVSTDLELIGNASEKDLRRTLAEVQDFRETLRHLIPGLDFGAGQKTILIALKDPASFQRFAPRDGRGRRQRNVGGYFAVHPYANVMVLPIYAQREATYQVAFHEYVHYLVYRNLGPVPAWVNEGLAEFYSTFFVDRDGRAIIGRAPGRRVSTLMVRSIMPLSRFLNPETAARLFEHEGATEVFYAQAWAFVHFLTLSDKGARRGQLLKYLQALPTAPSHVEAARQAFGPALDDVGDDLERYVLRLQLPAMVVPRGDRPQSEAARLEPLTEADAWHVQGRLLADVGAPEEAEQMLNRALAAAPAHRGARVALGRIRLQQERREEGLQILTVAADEAPDDFEAHFYLGGAFAAARRYEESLKAFDRAVTIDRQSAVAWFGLSQAALALNRASQADAAMRQVQGRYSDPSWYFSRARFALHHGRNDVAARDATEYLRRAGWADDSGPYAAFIGAMAHWRLNQHAEAEALLAAAARAAAPKSWTATVVRYLQEGLTDAAFLDAAKDNGQRTEARTYIGVRLLLAGRTEDAKSHFLWVKTRGERTYIEYDLAIAELDRLEDGTPGRFPETAFHGLAGILASR